MRRRNFLRGFVGAIAAAAVSARLIAQPPEIKVGGKTPFRPADYKGDFKWIVADTDRISADIHRHILTSSPWVDLVKRRL